MRWSWDPGPISSGKQKLSLRDLIARLEDQLTPDIIA